MADLIEEMRYINKDEDMYGTCDKAASICKYLELKNNKELLEKNNIIAIYGQWGSGKSCLMKNIEQDIDKTKFNTIWFDTWKYEKDDNLAVSLFKYIAKDNFVEKIKEKGNRFIRNAMGILVSISKSVEFNVKDVITLKPGDGIKEAQEQQEKYNEYLESNKPLWEKMQEFEDEFREIKFGGKKLVVFLDDLDRCESENIISLISSIKLLLSANPNIIFIIGIDRDAVTLALQNKYQNDYNKADEYLEKIFTINFEVPKQNNNDSIKKYIEEITDLEFSSCDLIMDFLKEIKFDNPRHIKKIFRKYYGMKNYLKENQIDVSNVAVVIFILYIIILANFQREEYKNLFIEKRANLYKDVMFKTISQNRYRDQICFFFSTEDY
ncbi:MAG: hypothetical protein IJH12_08760 [Clostridia bacterium]|nr:hypothetical protein [Clostridia bacterium]